MQADSGNNLIRKIIITSALVTDVAGGMSFGHGDGMGTNVLFNDPFYIAFDPTGTYALITDANTYIRQLNIASGVVTTLAGNGASGFADGLGTLAMFYTPIGLDVDPTGTYALVGDFRNSAIRRIALFPLSRTLTATASSTATPTASATHSMTTSGTASSTATTTATATHSMALVQTSGTVTTIAGSGSSGFADGVGTMAVFHYLEGVSIDPTGTYYLVADAYNNVIRHVDIASGTVTTFAGEVYPSSADGVGTFATFNLLSDVLLDFTGTFALITDQNNRVVRRLDISSATVTTLAGNSFGYADGVGTLAQFKDPFQLSFGGTADSSYVLVADISNNAIRRIEMSSASVTTLAGNGASGYANGVGTLAMFYYPYGVAVDPKGTYALVADTGNNLLRSIVISSALVTTVAGSTLSAGHADGMGTNVLFNHPDYIVFDPTGNHALFTEEVNNDIRQLNIASGVVTTLAGNGAPGFADGLGTLAMFNTPVGLDVDPTGTYALVGDFLNSAIRRITLSSSSRTLTATATGTVTLSATATHSVAGKTSSRYATSTASSTHTATVKRTPTVSPASTKSATVTMSAIAFTATTTHVLRGTRTSTA